jgi:hypothetical protein
MGGACSAYGGEECTEIWWENLRERGHWGDPVLGGRIIVRLIFMDWIELAQDRDRWRALVSGVMKIRVP